MKLNINFKEGFKRITLIGCGLILLIGAIFSYQEAILQSNPFIKLKKYEIISPKGEVLTVERYTPPSEAQIDAFFELKRRGHDISKIKQSYNNSLWIFIRELIQGIIITLLLASGNYLLFVLVCWIFSGFKTNNDT